MEDHLVHVSGKMARLCFEGCSLAYIQQTCHGRCCASSMRIGGALIAVHDLECASVKAAGGVVINGLLQTVDGRCPFQDASTFTCTVHDTAAQPLGCRVSPFKLNDNGTLVIRQRNIALCCYRKTGGIPAFKAYRSSLIAAFGDQEAARIVWLVEMGADTVLAFMPDRAFTILTGNNQARRSFKDQEA